MSCMQSLYTNAGASYRVTVETFNKQLSLRERISRVEVFFSLFSLYFTNLCSLFRNNAVQFMIRVSAINLLIRFELIHFDQKMWSSFCLFTYVGMVFQLRTTHCANLDGICWLTFSDISYYDAAINVIHHCHWLSVVKRLLSGNSTDSRKLGNLSKIMMCILMDPSKCICTFMGQSKLSLTCVWYQLNLKYLLFLVCCSKCLVKVSHFMAAWTWVMQLITHSVSWRTTDHKDLQHRTSLSMSTLHAGYVDYGFSLYAVLNPTISGCFAILRFQYCRCVISRILGIKMTKMLIIFRITCVEIWTICMLSIKADCLMVKKLYLLLFLQFVISLTFFVLWYILSWMNACLLLLHYI